MRNYHYIYSLALTLWLYIWPMSVFGQLQTINPADAAGLVTEQIQILGLKKTKLSVVRRELLIREDLPLDLDDLDESVQRLKNLNLFSHVDVTIFSTENNRIHIVLDFQELWTTIPILKFTSGGDTTYFVAGAYDINTMGRYLEFGAQYENWNGESGGVIWFRDPRFLNKRLRFGTDIWSVNQPREIYTQDGTSQGRYVLDRNKINLFVDHEFSQSVTAGFGFEMNKDRIINTELKQDIALPNEGITSTSVLSRLYVNFGRLNHDNFLLEGGLSQVLYANALSALGSDNPFYRVEWNNRYFWRVFSDMNFGAQFRLGSTNSKEIQHLYYIGGFENVRGYLDGQLRGQQFWQGNLEFRAPIVKWPWMVLQTNLFVDAAQVDNSLESAGVGRSDVFYSAGIGIRFVSPKIYRFIGRFDLALGTSHPATSRVSFGVQQFF